MAQRKLKSVGSPNHADQRRLRVADAAATPIVSPVRALHASLSEQLAISAETVLPVGDRVAIIAFLASLSWAVVAGSAYLFMR